ncbi:MAG: MXAN_2562 family outer membrane beta-barrel protein, partial [Nannocystaceae bacterium]
SDRKDTKKAKKQTFGNRYESPQRFALEIKLGPYLPNVDGRYDGPREFGPYAKIFGNTDARGITIEDPSQGLMAALAFEWQFLNPGQLGPLALGFQFSFFTDSARAMFSSYANADNPDDVPEDVDDVRSDADSVRFTSFPLALQLVYRLEYFADRFRVPLVPYAKAGLGYAFWYSKGGDGSISVNSADQKARGGVWGFQINAGGMLRLDFLERGSARTLDRATGINHTYIFGEYQFSQLDNFGRPSAISLGDSTFFVGLALEF